MEIISYAVVAVASIIIGGHVGMFLHRYFRQSPEPEDLDLRNADVRLRLTTFLVRNSIHGDARIIDGVVHPNKTENAHPLATVFLNAVSQMDRMRNPAATSIYVRDSVNDRFMLLADLDVDHLRDAATLLSNAGRKEVTLEKPVQTQIGPVDRKRLALIKATIKDQDRDSVVMFEGQELLVFYAQYLVEYVEIEFGKRNTEGL